MKLAAQTIYCRGKNSPPSNCLRCEKRNYYTFAETAVTSAKRRNAPAHFAAKKTDLELMLSIPTDNRTGWFCNLRDRPTALLQTSTHHTIL
jgi:hypothetical protein